MTSGYRSTSFLGIQIDFVSRTIENCERRLDEFFRIAGIDSDFSKHFLAQEAEVMTFLPMLLHDGFADFE
jgi:hypothetical protein